ncbi:MAG: trehalose-phosphatase [Chloroflexi bacterium]|nr:trehalose-phosphatase [Chloroflexota bacterium]
MTGSNRAPAAPSGPATTGLAAARSRAIDLLRAPSPLLVVTDFDGTLAPISLDPEATAIEPLGRTAIRRLARLAAARPERLALVVLSGRLAADVAGRVRVGGVRYLGNHGLESGMLPRSRRAEALQVAADAAFRHWQAPTAAVADAVLAALGRPGWLFFEAKGPTVAFHFRQAPDPDVARVAVIEAIEAAERALGVEGLVQVEGRRVVELRPNGAGGKGAAMRRLIEHHRPGGVLVLGDDVSDAEAFAVVREARDRGTIAGLAVVVHGAGETAPAIRAAADLELASPREAARLLSSVAAGLEREAAGG